MNRQKAKTQRETIREFIVKWNNNYPIDFLWRKKYGVAFGSPEHRQMSFLDMVIDYEEDKMFTKILSKHAPKEDTVEDSTGGQRMTQKEVDETFDNIDLEQFNNPPTNG